MSEEEPTKSPHVSAESTNAEASISDGTKDAGASESPEAEPVERPRKKKGRLRKKASSARKELAADGVERPAFLLGFPEDPELEPLIAAFEAGNYAHVRETALRLAETSERADVKAAALELLRRIEPDPLVKFLLGIAIALFVVVVAYVYHAHGS